MQFMMPGVIALICGMVIVTTLINMTLEHLPTLLMKREDMPQGERDRQDMMRFAALSVLIASLAIASPY
jgi:hypothetical protein